MMTNEERRQKLIRWLRDMAHAYGQSVEYTQVADELERLAEELQHQHACDKAQQQEIERLTGQVAATTTLYNNLYNRMEQLTTLVSGNVRLVEELEDGAIFEIGPGND